MRLFSTVLTTILTLTALSVPASAAPDRQAMDDTPQYIGGRLVLPAWETKWERMARFRKDTDQNLHDYRTAHPEMYGVTTAPVQPVKYYAEYEPSDAVYYVWDPGVFDPFFADITHELLVDGSAEVVILHHGAADRASLEGIINAHGDDASAITFMDVATMGDYYVWQTEEPYDRSIDSFWTVDFGPFWVEDGAGVLSIIDPRYYFWRINDDTIPHKLANSLGVNVFRPDLGYEGGNLFSDGLGTCFATGAHVAYNASFTEQEINDQLFDYFGCEKMFWLEPMYGEGTGHVDMFFKNASSTTLIVGEYDAALDPGNAAVLDYNAAMLAAETNAAGEPFQVLRVPMPDNSDEVFRSYTNGIVVNDLVLVPVYSNHDDDEAAALAVFEQAFPGRTVVGIDSENIIEWGGAIHCVTRTRPVGTHSQMETPPTDACSGAYQCNSGCADLDFTGDCVYGIPVYCTGGQAQADPCYPGQRCGWDLTENYFYCVEAGCGNLPAGGECRVTDEGDDVLITCNADGYPEGERCPAGTECGMLSSGDAGCRAPCTDDCNPGDQYCDAGGNAITCGEADDGDDCYEELATPCGANETCNGGVCTCADECAAGDGGCDADGNAWTCGEAGDGDTCLEPVVSLCGAGTRCQDATCVPDAPKKGCGCASATPGDLGGFLLVLGLFALFALRRRRICV